MVKMTAQLRGHMDFIVLREAMALTGLSRQALHQAIQKRRLVAHQDIDRRWLLTIDDLDRYLKSRYDRHETIFFNGAKVFDGVESLTAQDAAAMLGVKIGHIHYAMRSGYLVPQRVGQMYLFSRGQIEEYGQSRAFTERRVLAESAG
jgi:hypothetical protein